MTAENSAELPVSEESANVDAGGANVQFLTFAVENAEYGVDIMKVREIKGWEETTRIPNSPEYMRGVINLRGVVIPIFDLRARFSMGVTEANEKNVVIIIAVGSRIIGILVDAVSDILTVMSDEIKPPPSSGTEIDEAYVNGLISVEEKMVVLLDAEKLFNEEVLDALDNVQVKADGDSA